MQVSIKKYQAKQKEEFIGIFMNEELCKFMSGGAFDKEKDAEHLFENILFLNKNINRTETYYGIFSKEKFIGHFELKKNEFTKKDEIEIVYLLKKEFWGKGLMKKIIIDFQIQYKEQFVARVFPNNFNSIKMLEKIGIKKQTITKFDNRNVIKITLKQY